MNIIKVKQFKIWPILHWKSWAVSPSEHQEPHARRHAATFRQTWTFSDTAVRTSDFTNILTGPTHLPMQAVAPSASSAPSSRGDHCLGLSLQSSNNGCFSGRTNCFSISWHSKSNSSSVLQKKHCESKQSPLIEAIKQSLLQTVDNTQPKAAIITIMQKVEHILYRYFHHTLNTANDVTFCAKPSYLQVNTAVKSRGKCICYCNLTHWGRVTQICVFALQLCKTDDANLRF